MSQQTTYNTCWQYIREYYDYRASLKQSAYDIDIKKYVSDIVDEDDDLQVRNLEFCHQKRRLMFS